MDKEQEQEPQTEPQSQPLKELGRESGNKSRKELGSKGDLQEGDKEGDGEKCNTFVRICYDYFTYSDSVMLSLRFYYDSDMLPL